ncbi:MAG: hypothetical protein ABF608_08245 [Sporolactobacillus sp.]
MKKRPKTITTWLLIVLQFFLGLGAVFGGGALTLAPDGSLLRIPLSILKYGPFHTFLIPGLILLVVLGIYPLIIAIFLISERHFTLGKRLAIFRDKYWAWSHSLYIGFLLIGWITIEMFLIQAVAIGHLIYMFWALVILALTLLPSVQHHYARSL